MSCKLSDKCDNVFACNVLRPNVELLGCNFYKPKKPMTNEEWLRSCTTEQLAEVLTKFILDDKRFRMTMVGGVNETKLWLKQPHTFE